MENATEELVARKAQLVIPDTESLGKLESMEKEFSLTVKYKSKEDWARLENEPLRCFFMGTKEIPNDDGEMVLCGVFISKKECFIAGGLTLIESVRNLPEKTPIEITFRGSKSNKSSKGSTMIFEVERLG